MITIISIIVMITMIFIMIMMTKANTQERDSLFVPSMHTSTIVCSALSPWSKTGAFYYPRWNNWWLWSRWWGSCGWWRWWWWQQRWRWHEPCKGILRAGGARRARCQEPATFCPLCHLTGCWHHDHHHHHHGDDHQYYHCMSIVDLCHFFACFVIKDVIIIIMRMTKAHLSFIGTTSIIVKISGTRHTDPALLLVIRRVTDIIDSGTIVKTIWNDIDILSFLALATFIRCNWMQPRSTTVMSGLPKIPKKDQNPPCFCQELWTKCHQNARALPP